MTSRACLGHGRGCSRDAHDAIVEIDQSRVIGFWSGDEIRAPSLHDQERLNLRWILTFLISYRDPEVS